MKRIYCFSSERTNLGSVSSHLFQPPCWGAGLSTVPLLFWPRRFYSTLWSSAFTSRWCTAVTCAQLTEAVKLWTVKYFTYQYFQWSEADSIQTGQYLSCQLYGEAGRAKPRKAFHFFFFPLQDQIFAQAFYIFDSKERIGISNYIRRAHPCFELIVAIYTYTKQAQNSTWKRGRTLHLLPGSLSAYNTRCKGDAALPRSTVYGVMCDPSKGR